MATYIDIICPKCAKKALFQSVWVGNYVLFPDRAGRASCLHCGYNKEHIFSNKDYFYQIEVGNRKLYARSIEDLKILQAYFREKKGNTEPSRDFPKLFYLRREEIIAKIDVIIEKEK